MLERGIIKKCPACQDNFEATRANQKYCNVECKNYYNNQNTMQRYHERKGEDEVCRHINKILFTNREILKNYIGQEVLFSAMKAQGFQNRFVTGFNHPDNKNDKIVFACYDVGYQFITEERMKIFQLNHKS